MAEEKEEEEGELGQGGRGGASGCVLEQCAALTSLQLRDVDGVSEGGVRETGMVVAFVVS